MITQMRKTFGAGGLFLGSHVIRSEAYGFTCAAHEVIIHGTMRKKRREKLSSRCAKRKPNRFVEFTKKKAATATSTGRLNALD